MKANQILLLLICFVCLISCHKSDPVVDEILNFEDPKFRSIVLDPRYEFQMIYTEITRKDQNVSLTTHSYNLDTSFYFYPASTVKMPVAFLALQRMNELGLSPDLDMKTDSVRIPQSSAHIDSTTVSGYPNVARYIEKLFVVSDNDAYNRLYEFLGQDYINTQLKEKGVFTNSRIRTRVGISGFSTEDNKYTNPIRFFINDSIVYMQPEQKAKNTEYVALQNTQKGMAYYENEQLIEQPFDMSQKNFINLKDLESSLQRIIVPQYFSENERYDLGFRDYNFLMSAMSKTPDQYPELNYDSMEYYDSYVKFFMFGDEKKPIPNHIKIHNKVGYAYGYLTDVAYIIDYKNNVEFFLTATLQVNENQTFNDNVYEYDDLGIPFLAELGRRVYQFELSKRKHKDD